MLSLLQGLLDPLGLDSRTPTTSEDNGRPSTDPDYRLGIERGQFPLMLGRPEQEGRSRPSPLLPPGSPAWDSLSQYRPFTFQTACQRKGVMGQHVL